MKTLFLTYKDFSQYMVISKPLKIILYPFAIIFHFLFVLFLLILLYSLIKNIENRKHKSYRNSKEYKKVIKEGILFDTIEYHEK